ncbi:MAG: hypothetical protein PHX38_09760 [Sulfuricella sp.]|nr:hypothetical protein [Sulfuricella sp.]
MIAHRKIKPATLAQLRNRMVNSLLVTFAWLGAVALTGSMIDAPETGWQAFMAGEIGTYVYIIGLTLQRRRLSYAMRAYSLVGAAFVLGVGETMTWGLIGFGGYFLLLCLILAILLLDKTAGIGIFGAVLAFVGGFGAAVGSGLWSFDNFDVARYSVNLSSWVSNFFGILFFATLILLGLSRVLDALSRSFASLLESNEALKREVVERKQAEQATHKALDENRALTRLLLEKQEEEKKHLAHDLSEDTGQWLTATELYARSLASLSDSGEAAIDECTEGLIESVGRVHSSIRTLIRDLRPESLDKLGLADSLRELAGRWQRSNPDVALELSLEGELDNLDDPLNIVTYRFVQEGLANAAKYTAADRVSVRALRKSGSNELILSIGDNRKGRYLTEQINGMGLRGIRRQISAIGGELTIRAQPGNGVQIEAQLPVR